MPETATYVYCLVREASAPRAARVPAGVPGSGPVRVIGAGRSLWLVATDVPLGQYGPGPLETALRDMTWVSDAAVAHEAVVEHFARRPAATVVPMKLFTMFSSDDRAVAEMRARRRDIGVIVRRIAGCEEWGVRIARAAGGPRGSTDGARPASGAAFLAAKKQARDEAREAAHARADAAEQAYEALLNAARDARRRTDAPAGADVPPLLDAAFLVPTARRAAFKTAARKAARVCANAGAAMTLSGPWPAYNFSGTAGPSR